MTSKIHFHFPNNDLPPIPSRNHDYDPSWDYELADPPTGQTLEHLRIVTSEIEEHMLPRLGIEAAILFFVEPGGLSEQTCGKYVDGTADCPVIGLDIQTIIDGASNQDHLKHELAASLAHEIGHAVIDSITSEDTHDIDPGDEENAVEAFAQVWALDRLVKTSFLEDLVEQSEMNC